ncbi:hypothetical protein [Saezia sanguinis]|uniref:hypothetical protein n=1 Tax=Saezia sanguinis TaxID=1965230 RepID=UPI0030709E8D
MTNGYIREMKVIYTPNGILMGGGGRDGVAKGAVGVPGLGTGDSMGGSGSGGGAKWALVVTGSVICDRYEIGQLELQQEQTVGR